MTIVLGSCSECGAKYIKRNIKYEDYQDYVENKEFLVGKILICPNCSTKWSS